MQKHWQLNLSILWLGSFITELGNALTLPFLPLYIATLGNYHGWTLNILSSIAFAVTYLAKTIVSPIWGRLADRHGRKLMCLRASGVMTLTIFANAWVPNVWWLIIFRALQGAFSGYINNAQALIADATPAAHEGHALGTLATGGVTGTLLGPLIGGLVADQIGYRATFIVAAIGMLVVFISTALFVTEDFVPQPTKSFQRSRTPISSLLLVIFLIVLTVQAASTTIQPIVSLFVHQLSPHSRNLALLSGLVTAAPGLATLLAAPRLGKLVDRIGAIRVIYWGLAGAAIILIPMLWLTNTSQLVIGRFCFGLTDAAIIPAYQTLMTQLTNKNEFGQIFSYSQSFQAFGNVIGPVLGGVLASVCGFRSIFILTLMMELGCLVALRVTHRTAN